VTTVARPRNLASALDAVRDIPEATLLAGGTDLVVGVNFGRVRPSSVVALRRVVELSGWSTANDHVDVGANVTYRAFETELKDALPALAAAARTVGSPQIRNVGTIGGNLGTASPAGDTLPVLVALDARVRIAGQAGAREMSVENFIVGPKQTRLGRGEIIASVFIPRVVGPQQFLKVGTRNAMVIAIASLALVLDVSGRTVRCGLGSVGPRPLRPRAAEDFISARIDWESLRADRDDLDRFAEMVVAESMPITDVRSTAEYRRHCVRVLAERALTRSLAS
jgi:CO/xanthine dehydrogenase FAD-binding subunit